MREGWRRSEIDGLTQGKEKDVSALKVGPESLFRLRLETEIETELGILKL